MLAHATRGCASANLVCKAFVLTSKKLGPHPQVGAVQGGSGRTCASLQLVAGDTTGRQECVVVFEALSALTPQALQVCIQPGPRSAYVLGGTQVASVSGGGGTGYSAAGYVFDAAGTSCLGSLLALSLGVDQFGTITSVAIQTPGEGYTCPPRFRSQNRPWCGVSLA